MLKSLIYRHDILFLLHVGTSWTCDFVPKDVFL